MKRTLLAAAVLLVAAPALSAAPLSLLDDRFSVEAEWRTADGQTGFGTPVRLTPETGYFWFFSPTNTEVVVKVLDGCAVNGRFWVFAGGLTDTEVTLTVTDEANGTKKVYRNPRGTPFEPIQDTGAFATCALEHCGRGRLADLAASPRAHKDLEAMASAMTGALAAPQAAYDRVVADVAAIGRQNHALENIPFLRSFATDTLELEVDFPTGFAIAGDDYTAWSCLNERYGLRQVTQFFPSTSVKLVFDKVLDVRQLVADYEALPGVTKAQPMYYFGGVFPGPIWIENSYCGKIEGSLYKYFIRYGSTIHHYTSQPGAAPVAAGTNLDAPLGSWVAEANACFVEHVDTRS